MKDYNRPVRVKLDDKDRVLYLDRSFDGAPAIYSLNVPKYASRHFEGVQAGPFVEAYSGLEYGALFAVVRIGPPLASELTPNLLVVDGRRFQVVLLLDRLGRQKYTNGDVVLKTMLSPDPVQVVILEELDAITADSVTDPVSDAAVPDNLAAGAV